MQDLEGDVGSPFPVIDDLWALLCRYDQRVVE